MKRLTCGAAAAVTAVSMLLCSCSANLGPETLPSTTPATEPTETEPTETEETLPPEATEPSSVAVVTERIVDKNGRLKIDGTKITNSEDETVVLKGITSYGIQDCEGFFTSETVKTLAEDWGCDVIRIAVKGDENSNGYTKDPEKYFDMVCKICDMCIDQGIYVIVDWNVCYVEEDDETKEAAVDFFTRLSAIYAESPNVIYEVANDPLLDDELEEDTDEWEDVIVPFVTEVIDALRENSPDSIVIVGTPERGLGVDTASESMLDYDNIAYACRFFSGTHGRTQRDRVQTAIDNDACVIATEWGLGSVTDTGNIYPLMAEAWLEFFNENEISWCNYAIGNNLDEASNALLLNAENYTDEQKTSGHWPEGLLSDSGRFARDQFLYVPVETQETSETTEEE